MTARYNKLGADGGENRVREKLAVPTLERGSALKPKRPSRKAQTQTLRKLRARPKHQAAIAQRVTRTRRPGKKHNKKSQANSPCRAHKASSRNCPKAAQNLPRIAEANQGTPLARATQSRNTSRLPLANQVEVPTVLGCGLCWRLKRKT